MSDEQWLNPPPGKAMGCLPRASKVGQWAPILSDHIQVIDPRDWDGILSSRADSGDSLNGRDSVNAIKDQDGIGSCATEACSQAYEVIAERSGYPFEKLNPWSMYRIVSGGVDRGSNIDTCLKHAREVGILPCSYFPRYDETGRVVNRWNARPPAGWEEVATKYRIDEWYDMTSIAEVGTALLLNFVVQIGWSSHSELLVDLLPDSKALVANSWSTEWGDNGFHVEPLSKINWSYGAFAVRTIVDRGV